jgi:hypothetical protein
MFFVTLYRIVIINTISTKKNRYRREFFRMKRKITANTFISIIVTDRGCSIKKTFFIPGNRLIKSTVRVQSSKAAIADMNT